MRIVRLSLGLLILGLALGPSAVAVAGPGDPGYTKAFACSACHGYEGASRSDTVPVLAGMPTWYLKKAIEDYASGKRPAAEMEPYAKMVLGLGVDDVAGYFARQTKRPTPITSDPGAVARGQVAAQQCVVCHGTSGKGDASKGVPDLTGQPPGYLLHQMLLFKADKRSPGEPVLQALKTLMKSIPDAQLADLAAFWSRQR